MLISCTVYYWAGWPNKEKRCILNTQRMSKVVDMMVGPNKDVDGSRLLYSYNEGHRKGTLQRIEIDKTEAEINAASEHAPENDLCDVWIYPDDDITKSPVRTYFKVRDVARAIDAPDHFGASYLWIQENEVRLRRYLVGYGLAILFGELMDELN